MDTILPSEIKARLAQGEKLTLIDVREDDEVAEGMIPGAIHIPLGQIPDRLSEIPQERRSHSGMPKRKPQRTSAWLFGSERISRASKT